MAVVVDGISRTFSEYLLLPNLTRKRNVPANVRLQTPLVSHPAGESAAIVLNVPMASAVMQTVSDDRLAVALARHGGISFIFGSQPIDRQAEMVRRVKKFKAGFVVSDSNLRPDATLRDAVALAGRTGHTTMAVTEDGQPDGPLLGVITSRDYRVHRQDPASRVDTFMTPFDRLVVGRDGISLNAANDLIWEHGLSCLPIIDGARRLRHLVFRRDYDDHRENPDELVDEEKRLVVGAGISSHDYRDRVPPLVDAGVSVLCIDSSDGFNEWQAECLEFVRSRYGERVRIGAGNVVEPDGFEYLADAGADFVKVGIGGGSICTTREQKGIGRGQATAVLDVAAARDRYAERSGRYVPVCSDGGIVFDYHVVLALAMGADFVMMGRYFARFDESPGRQIRLGTNVVKEYWGEGTNRAQNWARYDAVGGQLAFEEGVDGYVPYAGSLASNLQETLAKIRATMCNCGALDIPDLRRKARLTVVSAISLREGGMHDVVQKERELVTEP